MSLCNVRDFSPEQITMCGEPGSHPVGCKDEIPFEKRALTAAASQTFAFQPDEDEWQVIGVILDGDEATLLDISLEDFTINTAVYDAIVGSSSTATVVSGAAYSALGFSRVAFYHWGDRQGGATPYPRSILGARATIQKLFSFKATNDHASATKNVHGTIVIVRRYARPKQQPGSMPAVP